VVSPGVTLVPMSAIEGKGVTVLVLRLQLVIYRGPTDSGAARQQRPTGVKADARAGDYL
jgi:hypothetical protein